MEKTPKYERFFAKGFDERFPLAWWRFVDPLAGFDDFLVLGQRVTDALHLPITWDFYEARLRLRSKFENFVHDKALVELRRIIITRLHFYRERGYEIERGLGDIIMRDLVNALVGDTALAEQMTKLQLLPVGRKALYYRIWAVWQAEARHGASIVDARVRGGK